MFDNVIVGADGHDAGRDALWLARQLTSVGGHLTLAYVQAVIKPDPDAGAVSLATERRPVMEGLVALRDEAGLDARVLWVEARAVAKGLHDLAVRGAADLLVVGASRRDEYERTFVGDESTAVLERAPCAVAVAPTAYASRRPPLKEIAAAYDGSPESEEAVAAARELARERGARLSAFQAVREPIRVRDSWYPERDVDERVGQARERLTEFGDLEAHAASGEAVDELARYGASVDLLVLGSHRYGPIDHLASSSTAQRLAESPPCPLLVLSTRRAAER